MPEENMIQEIGDDYVEAELVPGEGNTEHEEPPAALAASVNERPPAAQPAGRPPMEGRAFVRGYPLRAGARLGHLR